MLAILLIAAQTPEIPAIVRASPRFSGAIGGNSLDVAVHAQPTAIPLGESTTFTLVVQNVRNPADVKRPVPDDKHFAVENLETVVSEDRALFRYRLRPRSVEVKEIPSIRFEYFNPDAAEGSQLRTRETAAIPLTVTPSVVRRQTPLPERFQRFLEPRPREWQPTAVHWLAVALVSFLGTVLYVLAWRGSNPRGVRLAKLKRHRAVRRALAKLSRDPSEALREYLSERFSVPVAVATPQDVGVALRGHGVSEDAAQSVRTLLEADDAARFGHCGNVADAERVREIILTLESAA